MSPLLHTPLMSLTNAISAISVVGAILVAGDGDAPHAQPRARLHRRDRGHHQHRRRIPDHRPHAEDVPQEGAGQRDSRMMDHIWQYSLSRRGAARHPFHQMAELAGDRAPRRFAGEIGMLLAVVGTLLRHEVVNYEWIWSRFSSAQRSACRWPT